MKTGGFKVIPTPNIPLFTGNPAYWLATQTILNGNRYITANGAGNMFKQAKIKDASK